MLRYIGRRLLEIIPLWVLLSMVVYVLVELPPGDVVTIRVAQLKLSGITLSEEQIVGMRVEYGVDQPIYTRYTRWMYQALVRGDLGRSYSRGEENKTIIMQALPWTLALSLSGLLISWLIAIPLGIYSATHQYTFFDYLFTFIGFFGMCSPGFLLAMGGAWLMMSYLGFTPIGLYSSAMIETAWGWPKFVDLMKHLAFPLALLALGGTGGMMRTIRNNLLDQLRQQYVVTARAKGIPERRVLLKYPVRLAINPVIGGLGFVFRHLLEGGGLITIVLGVPTLFPVLLGALQIQDYNLAGTILMILATMTLIGTLISDVLLALVDPRIRFEGGTK
jgi:peptide/nickel transport system permease protein